MPGIEGICWPLARTAQTAKINPARMDCLPNIRPLPRRAVFTSAAATLRAGNLREMEGDQILRIGKAAVPSLGGDRMGTSGPSAMRFGCDSNTTGAGIAVISRPETESWDIEVVGPRSWSSWPQGAWLPWLER